MAILVGIGALVGLVAFCVWLPLRLAAPWRWKR